MTNEKIMQQLCMFLTEEFEISPTLLKPEALLQKDIGIDSLDYVDLVVHIYDTFGFKPKQEDLKQIKTLSDLCEYIARHNASN